jgi:anhydro-N-acetylmuramic acid kinase
MADLFIGLMSGTSLDGVDAVLVRIGNAGGPLELLAHEHCPFGPALAAELLALNSAGDHELHRAALAANAVAEAYAAATAALLRRAGAAPRAVRAIGAHGQTVRHRPLAFDSVGYTVQLLNGALLAERTGIDVATDFRSRDLAAGGQGAPLVPVFHRQVFARAGQTVVLLNLGGMSNVTVLDAGGATTGFDCGPGNVLLDHWIARHRGEPFDAAGAWAATGRVHAALLAQLLAHPFFALPPPKSTGREDFHAGWLDAAMARAGVAGKIAPVDVQATLAELTARVVADAVARHADRPVELLVCGGGANNAHLMSRLAALLSPLRVTTSDARGLPSTQVEACAFAWLAQAWLDRRPGNLPSVTGALGPRVLGALYPAR